MTKVIFPEILVDPQPISCKPIYYFIRPYVKCLTRTISKTNVLSFPKYIFSFHFKKENSKRIEKSKKKI